MTRGLVILVARLTAREHKRIFSLCHYFARVTKWLPDDSYYRGRTEAFNTKIGLSGGAVTGWSFLCDELPDFGRSENDRQPFRSCSRLLAGFEPQFGPLAKRRPCRNVWVNASSVGWLYTANESYV